MHQYPGNHLVSLSELQKINQRAWRIFLRDRSHVFIIK